MSTTRSVRAGALLIALALLMPVAFAGKGNGNGKPGGGGGGDGGGSNLPAFELVFLAREAGTNCGNCYELFRAVTPGVFEQITFDTNRSYNRLVLDPRGDVAFTQYGAMISDLDSGVTTAGSVPAEDWRVIWTRQRANGDLLTYGNQRYLRSRWDDDVVIRGDTGESVTVPVQEAVLRLGGDSTDDVMVTDSASLTYWDDATDRLVRVLAHPIAYIPEQASEQPGRAWFIYREEVIYLTPDGAGGWTVDDRTNEQLIRTLDTSDWSQALPDQITTGFPSSDGPTAGGGYGSTTRMSADGRWLVLNRAGVAYVVAVDYSGARPVFPEPGASDVVPVVPPSGWEPEVEIVDINEDGTLVALHLFRVERTSGRRKDAPTRRNRHLFVARTDGSDLTQVDVDSDDVFEFNWGNDNFLGVKFRPLAP